MDKPGGIAQRRGGLDERLHCLPRRYIDRRDADLVPRRDVKVGGANST
jgi:hypothetical protein